MQWNALSVLTQNCLLRCQYITVPLYFICVCLKQPQRTPLKTTAVWPQMMFSIECFTVSVGPAQLWVYSASLCSLQQRPLLSILNVWCIALALPDSRGLNSSEYVHIFQLASWYITDMLFSGATCYIPRILLLIFPRIWCWWHMNHLELQV